MGHVYAIRTHKGEAHPNNHDQTLPFYRQGLLFFAIFGGQIRQKAVAVELNFY